MKRLLVFVVLFGAVSASASDDTLFGRAPDKFGPKPHSVTFSILQGWYWNAADQFIPDTSQKFTDAWLTGIRAGWAFSENFELEGSAGYSPTKNSNGSSNNYIWGTNVIAQHLMAEGRFVPYFTFGVGQAIFDPENNSYDTDFAINYGAGAKIFIFKNLAFGPDIRGLTSFDSTHTAVLFTLNLLYYAQTSIPTKAPAPAAAAPGSVAPAVTPAPSSPSGTTPPPPVVPPAVPESRKELSDYSGVITGVKFNTNSAVITQDSYVTLDKAATFFVRHPELKVSIDGHTDDTGSHAHNQRLSEERASAVKHYLISKGLPTSKVIAQGYGENRPIAENATPEGRARNRRIEFRILNAEEFQE